MCVEVFALDLCTTLKHDTISIRGIRECLQVQYVRTGLRRPLHQLVCERSDAFARDGGQGEGVLRVRFQTLHRVRIPRPEGQLLLRERRKRSRGQDERWDEGSDKEIIKETRLSPEVTVGAGRWG